MELFDVISKVESADNQHAIRFEPETFSRLVTLVQSPRSLAMSQRQDAVNKILANICKIHGCSMGTAEMIYSSSWGSVQIMGFNLYSICDYTKPVVDYMNTIDHQKACFARYLVVKHLQYSPQELSDNRQARLDFAMKYNGSIGYCNPLEGALIKCGFKIS